MIDSFISKKDKIVLSAIELISEAGLQSLSTKMLAMKENMSESALYKYFGGVDEIIRAVVDYFLSFDDIIMATLKAKRGTNIDKIRFYFDTYATYYENYPEIAAITLNYEVLLHNTDTRDVITNCIIKRKDFLAQLIQTAIDEEEINAQFTAEELAFTMLGIFDRYLLNRRVEYHKRGLKSEVMEVLDKTLDLISIKK